MPELNWKSVSELRDIFIKKYTDSELGCELEKACSEEYELARDYNGRQILELLQNVDDAYEETNGLKEVVVKISFKDNLLEVGNTGTIFSAETIERLCLGRASNKSSENIGNKGTGFRSLLNDAEYIELHSGDFSIKFSESYAYKIFNEYKNEKKIKYQIDNWKKDYPLCFPTMNCPELIGKADTKFDTLIRVKLKSGNTEKETGIESQLRQPFYKSLLFLPNITKIIIETEKEAKEYSKIVNNHDVLIEEKIEKEKQREEKYFLYDKLVSVNKKNANLIIAIPKDTNYDFSNEKLYCYFPIRDFQAPIHALIHAPFITNSSRDDIPNDDRQINKSIFKELLFFIKEIAEKLTEKNISELPLKTLVPFKIKSKLWSSDGFNLEDYYNDLLKTAKILPTVNNKNISFEDEPKLFEKDFPKEFSGVQFKQLLIPLKTECRDFVLKLSDYYGYKDISYERDDLINRINSLTETWDIKTQTKVFIWWSKNFGRNVSFPNLLKDSKDRWIDYSSKVYLPTDTGISVLPDELSWVNLCVLKQNYVEEIIEQAKENYSDEWNKYYSEHNKPGDKRILADISNSLSVKFIEQSSLSLIISSINQQIVTFEQSKSFINWFFQNYKYKDLGNEVLDISFKLPDQKGEIKSIKELYLGKNYGNPIAEKLFKDTSKIPFVSLDEIYKGEERQEFIDFLKKCGMLEFPKIVEKDLSEWKFRQFVSEKYYSNENANYLTSYTIENFEKLISNLSMEEIKIWFEKDVELRNFLLSREEKSTVKHASNQYPYYFLSNAYLKYILNNTSWIEFNGKKYAPCKIIKSTKLKDKIEGVYGISESELKQYLGENIAINFKLDFKESFAELPDSDLKKILDVLPNFDKGEVSRNLYSDIIKFKKGKKPGFSTENLKLLAKDGKFYLNSEIKYADKRTCLSEKNKSKFIWIQPKQSIETIESWLGVERYKSNYKLKNYDLIKIEDFIKDFTSEINDIKIAVLCTIDSNRQNINNIRKFEIIPCSEIEVIDMEQNSEHIMLSEFFFVNDNNKYYLKISKDRDIKSIRCDNDFADAIVEIFKQALNLELDSNLIELLITKNKESKIKKIEEAYNSDSWNNSYEELFNKNPLNELIYNFFKEHNLEKKLYEDLITFDFTSDLQFKKIEILTHSLKSISKDIDDLNSLSDLMNINICPFLRENLKKYLDSNYEDYKNKLYVLTRDSAYEEKCKFLQKIENYRNFDVSKVEIENSINVDLEAIILRNFPILNNESNETIDIDRIYNNNVHTVIKEAKISPSDFDDFIQNNSKFNSVLYFEIPSKIQNALNEYMNGRSKQEKDMEQVNNDCETKTVTVRLEEINLSDYKNLKTRSKERSKRYYESRNSSNQKAGEEAENIAYNELKKKFPKIIWHSQYTTEAADRNNLPPDGVVCDMWNFDLKNGNSYFEIKSATNEFEMTIDEYKSMENNKDKYFIVLVNREKKEISLHKFEEIDSLKRIKEYSFIFRQI